GVSGIDGELAGQYVVTLNHLAGGGPGAVFYLREKAQPCAARRGSEFRSRQPRLGALRPDRNFERRVFPRRADHRATDMLTKGFDLLLREYRTRRLARFTAWVLAYGAALKAADRFTRTSGGVPTLLWFVFWVCALVSGVYYLARLMRFIRTHLLWRLRRRLVVAYILIGVVPISLIIVLVLLGAFIINGQFAAFLVILRLRDRFDRIEQVNRVVLHEARYGGEKSPPAMLERIRNFYVTEMVDHAKSYPGLAITLHLGDVTRSFLLDGKPAENPAVVPSWVKGQEYANIVDDQGQLALRSVERTATPAGELTLVLSQPFTPQLLDLVGHGIGPVGVALYKRVEPRAAKNAKMIETTPGETYVPG